MELSDQILKLLDRGEVIVLFKNQLGSYTAAAVNDSQSSIFSEVDAMDNFALTLTDGFTPGKALHCLSEKMFRTGDYQDWPEPKDNGKQKGQN